MTKWTDVDHWVAVVQTPSGEVTLTRDGKRLLLRPPVSMDSDVTTVVDLESQALPVEELQVVRESALWASDNYQKFRELISYRVEITRWLLAILIGQELVFFFLRHQPGPVVRVLRVGSWVVWAVGGVWLSQVYLTVAN
jgi:hypothetical protein